MRKKWTMMLLLVATMVATTLPFVAASATTTAPQVPSFSATCTADGFTIDKSGVADEGLYLDVAVNTAGAEGRMESYNLNGSAFPVTFDYTGNGVDEYIPYVTDEAGFDIVDLLDGTGPSGSNLARVWSGPEACGETTPPVDFSATTSCQGDVQPGIVYATTNNSDTPYTGWEYGTEDGLNSPIDVAPGAAEEFFLPADPGWHTAYLNDDAGNRVATQEVFVVGCGLPQITVENTCDTDGIIISATGENLAAYWLLGDSITQGGFEYQLTELPIPPPYGDWDFSLIDGDGVIVDPLAELDGVYVEPDGCDEPPLATASITASAVCQSGVPGVLTEVAVDGDLFVGIEGVDGVDEHNFAYPRPSTFYPTPTGTQTAYLLEEDGTFVNEMTVNVEECETPAAPEPPVLDDVQCVFDEGGDFLTYTVTWTARDGELSRIGAVDATPSSDTSLEFYEGDVPFAIYAYNVDTELTSLASTVTGAMLPSCETVAPTSTTTTTVATTTTEAPETTTTEGTTTTESTDDTLPVTGPANVKSVGWIALILLLVGASLLGGATVIGRMRS